MFSVVLLLVAVAGVGWGQEPTADEIVRRGVERADRQYRALADARFRSRVDSEVRSLNAESEVSETETTASIQYPVAGALFEEVVAEDGKELTAAEKGEQPRLREKFSREVEKRRARGEHPQPEHKYRIRFNQELVERYNLGLDGRERVRGYDCWVISFEPKSGDLPVRRRIDAALNKSVGKFWIADEDYGLVRLEFAMREPYKYWGGLLATVNNTEAEIEFERIAPDVWAPTSFDMRLDIKVLMIQSIRRQILKQWREYRVAEPDQALARPGS